MVPGALFELEMFRFHSLLTLIFQNDDKDECGPDHNDLPLPDQVRIFNVHIILNYFLS